MFEFENITNTPYTGPLLSQAYHAPPSSGTRVPTQAQDRDDSRLDRSFGIYSQAAGVATNGIATAQAALALAEALRQRFGYLTRIADELAMEKKPGKDRHQNNGLSLTEGTQEGPNLMSIEGIDAFLQSVRNRLRILEAYSDSLYTQMQPLGNGTLPLSAAGEGESDASTEGLAPNIAMSLAERVAGQVLSKVETSSDRVYDIDPGSVAALL